MIGPKIFLTDNYGVYFYLIGSLIFYFQMNYIHVYKYE